MERYKRQTILPEIGEQGQQALLDARIVVIGAGGLGCPSLAYLASSGIGHITIIDDDIIDESNLQRQILFTSQDVGSKKAEIAAMQLEVMNPNISITIITERLTPENIEKTLSGYDVILDGTDNFKTRYFINDTALKLKTPVVFGAITGFEGQITVFGEGESGCYRCLYPTPPTSNVRSCAEAGAVGPVAGIVGSVMALETMKLVLKNSENLKTLSNRLLIVDGRTMDVRMFPLTKKDDCICSTSS